MQTVRSAVHVIHLVMFATLLLSYLASHLTFAAESSVPPTVQPPKHQTGSLTTVQPLELQTGSSKIYNYPQYPYPFSQYPNNQYFYPYPYPLYPYPQNPYDQYPFPPPAGYGYPHVGNENPLSGRIGLAGNGNAGSGTPTGKNNLNTNTGGFPSGESNVPQNVGAGLRQNTPFWYPSYYGNSGYPQWPYGYK